ncbi:MAG TPA: protein TolR [Rhodanobacteraceae bacterium]|nr:protein TolR [Rhodanobacteraceae bacterium]
MQSYGRHRRRRKLKAEINVVPYIDVMLVLLIIFMVTAPLLNLGVDIQLPQSKAKSVQNDKEPAVVSVDKDGKLYLTLGPSKREPVEPAALVAKVSAFLRQNPQLQVLVAGDTRADYGRVYNAMVLLQQGGVAKVGLMSQPEQAEGAR